MSNSLHADRNHAPHIPPIPENTHPKALEERLKEAQAARPASEAARRLAEARLPRAPQAPAHARVAATASRPASAPGAPSRAPAANDDVAADPAVDLGATTTSRLLQARRVAGRGMKNKKGGEGGRFGGTCSSRLLLCHQAPAHNCGALSPCCLVSAT